jgi:hypothetical protein
LLVARRQTLGPDHPDTLTAAEWIANIQYDQP